jgi:hypothetical protein
MCGSRASYRVTSAFWSCVYLSGYERFRGLFVESFVRKDNIRNVEFYFTLSFSRIYGYSVCVTATAP